MNHPPGLNAFARELSARYFLATTNLGLKPRVRLASPGKAARYTHTKPQRKAMNTTLREGPVREWPGASSPGTQGYGHSDWQPVPANRQRHILACPGWKHQATLLPQPYTTFQSGETQFGGVVATAPFLPDLAPPPPPTLAPPGKAGRDKVKRQSKKTKYGEERLYFVYILRLHTLSLPGKIARYTHTKPQRKAMNTTLREAPGHSLATALYEL
jgi:hypothetical protein